MSGLLEVCRDVERRSTQGLMLAERRGWIDIALCHLSLGRATLLRAIAEARSIDLLSTEASESAEQHRLDRTTVQTVWEHLNAAVDGLRRAGTLDLVPGALLSRAWLRFLEGDPDGAREDLDEAWEIAERGPMRLHIADIHLHRARLFRDKEELKRARYMIEQCGYWRRKEELEDAEEATKHWP
jgi:hypothetical protein